MKRRKAALLRVLLFYKIPKTPTSIGFQHHEMMSRGLPPLVFFIFPFMSESSRRP